MGIKFHCPNGHKIHVKSFLAGKTGFCPQCHVKVQIPHESQMPGAEGASVILSTTDKGEPGKNGHSAAHGQAPPVAQTAAPAASAQGAMPVAPSQPASRNPTGPASSPAAGWSPATAAQPASPTPVPGGYSAGAAPAGYAAPAPIPAPTMPGPAISDPIAEAPTAVWYVRPPSGGQYGPAHGEVMRRWLGEGRVTANSYVWREGWPDWRQAASVFPALTAAQMAPVPAAPGVNGAVGVAPSVRSRRPRRTGNKALAITAIVVLALMSVAAFALLIYVLNKPQEPPQNQAHQPNPAALAPSRSGDHFGLVQVGV